MGKFRRNPPLGISHNWGYGSIISAWLVWDYLINQFQVLNCLIVLIAIGAIQLFVMVWAVIGHAIGLGWVFIIWLKELCFFAFLPIKLLFPSPLKATTILPLYQYNSSSNLHMSRVSVGNSLFGHYATNYNYFNNESLVGETACPTAIGREATSAKHDRVAVRLWRAVTLWRGGMWVI